MADWNYIAERPFTGGEVTIHQVWEYFSEKSGGFDSITIKDGAWYRIYVCMYGWMD